MTVVVRSIGDDYKPGVSVVVAAIVVVVEGRLVVVVGGDVLVST